MGNEALRRHDAEVPEVECQDPSAVAFGAGDYAGIRKSERQVGVTPDELADAG